MATTHESGSLTENGKPPKSSRRKMSWFKQASIGEKLTRLRLPRQNTLDCPNSAPISAPPGAETLTSSRRRIASGSSSVEVCSSCSIIQLSEDITTLHIRNISMGKILTLRDFWPDRREYPLETIIELGKFSGLDWGNCWIIIIY